MTGAEDATWRNPNPDPELVLKRLAEIEGIQYAPRTPGKYYKDQLRWNPLTNPADTYALIEKYHLHISPTRDGDKWTGWWASNPDGNFVEHESFAMAVCLAVIEANQGEEK